MSSFELRRLHEDGNAGEEAIVAAVVEVKVRVDDGRDLLKGDAGIPEGGDKIHAPGLVEVIDEAAAYTDASVNQNAGSGVTHEEAEDVAGTGSARMRFGKLDLREP